nr:hypothetical protein HUO10_004104 [Paraburkholderia busanensis]
MRFLDRFRKPTEERFARLFIGSLRSSGDTRAWEYDSSLNRLVPAPGTDSGAVNLINLHNMFREYAEARPAQRKEILKRQTDAMKLESIPTRFGEVRARLRPVIRSAMERGVTYLQTRQNASPQGIAFRPLCENLEIGIAYDGDSSIVRLTESRLKEWGVSFDEAYDTAIDNLRMTSSKPLIRGENGVWISNFGDHYDASRLLLTDLLHRQQISGAPVVMVPNRSVLLLTGDRNAAGFQTMLELAEQVFTQPRALPRLMLRWNGTAWQRFSPEGVGSRLTQLRVQEIGADYQDQLAHLKGIHEQEKIDIFIAQCSVLKNASGEMRTMCVWPEGVHTLLPATNVVALFRHEPKQTAFVPWPELIGQCAHLMKQTDYLPVRYEVQGFPDEQLFQSWCERFDTL